MEKKYYIRQKGIITGPFDRNTLLLMFQQGRLDTDDSLSTDKLSWQPPQAALNLIVPEEYNAKINMETAHAAPTTMQPQPVNAIPSQTPVPAEEKIPEKLPFVDLLLTVIASLGNGGGYLMRLSQYNSSTMFSAGAAAAFSGLFFGGLGCLLFGGLYNISKVSLSLHTLAMILIAGALFWLSNYLIRLLCKAPEQNKSAEADFLSAMHAMMHIGVLSAIINGVGFIFNSRLFDMSALQVASTTTTALLPLIFFICNTILSLRINLMGNCRIHPGTATLIAVIEFYLITLTSIVLLWLLYRFV